MKGHLIHSNAAAAKMTDGMTDKEKASMKMS